MKNNNLLLLVLVILYVFLGQTSLTAQTQTTSEKFLENVKKETEKKDNKLENEISELKKQIEVIDTDLINSKSSKKEIITLKSRIKILEEIEQNKLEQKRNILSDNFNSAIINLLALKKDIEPLDLYNASSEFYKNIEQISNPTNYADYNSWLLEYKNFLNKKKTTDVIIEMASNIINSTGVLNNSTLNLGPLSDILLYSIDKFIKSLGSGKKELKKQSAKMFKLLILLKSFENEKLLLDKQFYELSLELKKLEKIRKALINEVIKTTELNETLMSNNYFNQTDSNENFKYLERVNEHINKNITKFKNKEIKNQMYSVQSIKIRFGELLENMNLNLKSYKNLIEKYKENKIIDFSNIEVQYNNLEKLFANKFNGEKYKRDAIRMYNIE